MPLNSARNTPKRPGQLFSLPLAANATVYQGGIVCADAAGNAVPGAATAALAAMGVARETVANGAVAGANRVEVEPGVFCFKSAGAGDAVTRARIGRSVFIVDDETVAANNGAGARPLAGTCIEIDELGVWVRIEPGQAVVA